MNEFLPVTKIPRSGLPEYAIVVGDPKRAALAAGLLQHKQQVASNREYDTYRGTWKGTEVVIASHGVGGPGAMCIFQELAMAGVKTMIRAGTCGTFVNEIDDGDLIIATAAVREDGITDQMVPVAFPSFSTPEVVLALQGAAHNSGHRWHRGIVWTKSLFFPGVLTPPSDIYFRAGVIALEMELSALLVMAAMKGLRAGGILAVDGNPKKRASPAEYNPYRPVVEAAVAKMIEISLDACHHLAKTADPLQADRQQRSSVFS